MLLVRAAGGQAAAQSLLPVAAAHVYCEAFISTVNLDGETNLKAELTASRGTQSRLESRFQMMRQERRAADLLSAITDMPEAAEPGGTQKQPEALP